MEKTNMVMAKVKYGDRLNNFYNDIPAFIENGILVLGHNGCSLENGNYLDIPEKYKVKDFEYFADHTYRGSRLPNPHYLYKGKIPYELMKVIFGDYGSRKFLYTYLTPCREETYFCKCKDCGRNYVIDCYEVPFFKANNLTLPAVRCKSCIAKRKERNKQQ